MKGHERPCSFKPQLRSSQNVLRRSVEPATQTGRSTSATLDRLARLGDHAARSEPGRRWSAAAAGLEHYEVAIRENKIDTVLPGLTAEDLKAESDKCCIR